MERRETDTLDSEATRSSVDVPVEPIEGAASGTETATSRRGRLRERLGSLFSVRQFLLAGGSALAGLLVVGGALPLGAVGSILGIALGTFLHGALASRRGYVEAALAGAVVAGGAVLLDFLALTVAGLGLPIVGVGLFAGLVAAVVGHYFGRDLRHGLTRDLER